ncbi:MAG: hypothetical protein WDN49_19890 [Acetobacteraceae bacterium]
MHLYAGYSNELAGAGAKMVLARDFFDKIRTFSRLAEKMELTRTEELALLSLSAVDWQKWRSLAISPATEVPPLLERRLDYAIPLLERMLANASPADPAPKTGTS